MIYHHIFIEELFECFPQDLEGSQTKFLLIPLGDLIVFSLNELFARSYADFFDEDIIMKFEGLEDGEQITCFGCHREMNIGQQTILAHDIFHIIINKNGIKSFFEFFSNDSTVEKVLDHDYIEGYCYQLEELFCDYAACWYFGPIYLQSFANEISFHQISSSNTHPPFDLRAKFLLDTMKNFKQHNGYIELKRYLNLRKRDGIDLPNTLDLQKIGDKFQEQLEKRSLKRILYHDHQNDIDKLFSKNIPFVTDDVRKFINSIPTQVTGIDMSRHADIISESLRKINILRQAKQYIRDSDALLALPEALKNNE